MNQFGVNQFGDRSGRASRAAKRAILPPDRDAGRRADRLLRAIRAAARAWRTPFVTEIATRGRDPFHVLVSCLISLRTKDAVTEAATERLLALGRSPGELAAQDEAAIARAIYPAGFYRTKAKAIRELARRLVSEHEGRVPDSIEGLLAFRGVGRKTANLVVTLGYGKPGICVDTHVHRIANRLGIVRTGTPEQTETALRAVLPKRWWIPVNNLLVSFGQNVCVPVSPRCSACPVASGCPRDGVTASR